LLRWPLHVSDRRYDSEIGITPDVAEAALRLRQHLGMSVDVRKEDSTFKADTLDLTCCVVRNLRRMTPLDTHILHDPITAAIAIHASRLKIGFNALTSVFAGVRWCLHADSFGELYHLCHNRQTYSTIDPESPSLYDPKK
jgi:hypothetical protein